MLIECICINKILSVGPWIGPQDSEQTNRLEHLPHELEMTMLGEAHALKRMMADMTCIREKQTRKKMKKYPAPLSYPTMK